MKSLALGGPGTEPKDNEAALPKILANSAHELLTPLNAIIGFSSFLAGEKPGPLNEKQKEFLGDVLSGSRHLLRLINDLLDLANIEAGETELAPGPFSLRDAVAEVAGVLRPLLRDRQLVFQASVELDEDVILDEQKTKQVLYNLLFNAIKFTGQGGHVGLQARPCGDGQFELRVGDAGVGSKREDLAKLIVPSRQLDFSAAGRQEGTGLGLALAKKIVELQQGRISLESEPGKGSAFRVILPLHLKPEPKA